MDCGGKPGEVQGSAEVQGMAAELRAFLESHAALQLREAGQMVAQLDGQHCGYTLRAEAGKLVCHFWSREANLVRRVLGVRGHTAGSIELDVLRMGQPHPLRLRIAAAEGGTGGVGPGRAEFRQAILAAARREWRAWRYANEHGAAQEHSRVQRFLFRRQHRLLPCVALEEGEGAAGIYLALAQALVWAARCRQRHPQAVVAALRLIVPVGAERWLRLLRPALRAQPPLECYHWDRTAGRLEALDLADGGNVAARLRRAPQPLPLDDAQQALQQQVRQWCPQAAWETTAEGLRSLRVYGLELARTSTVAESGLAPFVFGCGGEATPLLEATRPAFEHWLRAVGTQRICDGDARQPWFGALPEAWMACLLRHDLGALDAHLDPGCVYSEIPLATPAGRGFVDLLARDREGRLVAIELKAEEDLAFPLQALGYWQQVRRHHAQGDFERLGYFPGRPLSPLPPRLWLVAPALRWHPQTASLVEHIAPEVPFERLGLNEEWRRGLQIIFRNR